MKKAVKMALAVAVIAAGCLLVGGCDMQQEQTHTSYREQIKQEGAAYLAQIGAQEYAAGTVSYVSETGSNWYCVPMSAEGKEPFHVFIRPVEGDTEIRDDRVLQGLSRQLSAQLDKLLPENAAGSAWVTIVNDLPSRQWDETEQLQTVADVEALSCRWYVVVPQSEAQTLETTANELAEQLCAQGWNGILYAAALPQNTIDILTAAQTPLRADWSNATAKGLHLLVRPRH